MKNIRLIAPFLCTLAWTSLCATLWAAPGDITIRGAEVWRTSDGPRVIDGAVTVEESASLTIQPGVAVKFTPGAGHGLTVKGRLEVQGTSESPVYFTSSLDRGVGLSRYPTSLPGQGAHPGDWDGIRIESPEGVSSTVENAIVRYSRSGLVTAGAGKVSTRNNVVRDTAGDETLAVHGAATTVATLLQPRAPQPNLMPSFTTAPSGWTVSRYAPAAFAPPSPTVFGRSSELQIQINQAQGYTNRPAAYQNQYYGFQGYQTSVAGVGTGDTISADIYVPGALGNSAAGNAASYMWAVGGNTGGQADFAIIGFTNSVGHGEFTVWDDGNQAWTDLATPVIYNSWNTLSIVFTGTTFDYYVNGARVYSMMNNFGSTSMQATIMDALNFFDPTTSYTGLNYSIVWANSATPTTTSLTSSLNPSTVGGSVTLTATVSPSSATGFVTFVDGTTIVGTGNLTNGVATLQVSPPTVGTHSLTAIYGGDGNDSGSTSAAVSQVVNKIVTTTTLSSSAGSAGAGQSVTLTSTVSPSTATGNITFYDNTSALGTVALVSGTARLITSFGYGAHSLTASYAGDANDAVSTSPVLTVSVPYPPVMITTGSIPAGAANQPYGPVSFAATGGAGAYSWSASGLPANLSLSTSGVLNGTPLAGFNGPVTISVTDSLSHLGASQTYTLVIAAPPLSVTGTSSLGDVLVNGSVSGSYTANGGLAPYTWSISGASGLSIDGNGRVTGAPTSAGNFTVTVSVRDSLGTGAMTTASLAVLGVATTSLPAASTTTNYSASIAVLGGVQPYNITATGVPAGITFSAGVFGGKPTTPGTYPVSVTVADSGSLSITLSYSITVTGNATLSVTSTSLPGGVVGQPYSAVLNATGGAPGYTWVQSGGVLPMGLSLSSNGTVSGVPMAPTPMPYGLGVQVTDTSGGSAVGSVSINIAPAPIQITTGALPGGVANSPYPAQSLTATGGIAPYTFSIVGSLPAGMSLTNGQIMGTPTSAGSTSFTIKAVDSAVPPSSATLAASITVGPSTTTLVLSSASASFSITPGVSATPMPVTIDVTSSSVSVPLSFSYVSSASWLTLSGASRTPGSIAIALNSAALALTSAGSPYTGTITVTCTSSACAPGVTQTIGVTLAVAQAPAQLSVDTTLLSFVAMAANPQSSSSSFSISNVGGGSLGITSITGADSWVGIGAYPSTLSSGPGAAVTVTANPSGLTAGYYRSTVNIVTSAGSASIPVTLLVSGSSSMTLGPAGAQFSAPQGSPLGNPSGSFLVGVTSTTPVTFTAAVTSGATWLSSGTGGSASASSPGSVSFSLNPTVVASLGAGAYYGSIRVSASGVVNSPLDFQVVLNISAVSTPLTPDVGPAGLVFITNGANALPPQSVSVYADSSTPVTYQASATIINGAGWLTSSPAVGTSSSSSPGQVQVNATPTGLAPGVYRGGVSVSFSTAAVRTVNVTLIVTSPLPSGNAISGVEAATPKAVCSGAQLVPTQTGLVSDFSSPASWPTPLAITLADTCGNLISNGQIVTTFSNGDPPLPLTLVDATHGLYSGTWTPRNPMSQVTVSARASAPGYAAATAQISGQVAPNTAPVLAPNATGDVFDPQVGNGLGPGNIVQIYGAGLAGQTITPAVLPLPVVAGGTSVLIGGVQAPLFYVSPGQINAQIPFTLAPNQQYQVIVSANGALTTPQPLQLNSGVPSVLQFTSGAVVAQHPDFSLVSATSPAAPGENLVIYLTGLGATSVTVPSGAASPTSPLAIVTNTPVLMLNSNPVPLLFAGLTPGLVGLYQINFQVPTTLANGNYTLAINQNGVTSNSTLLPVHN